MGVFANARKKTHNYLVISGIVRTFAMSKRQEKAKAQIQKKSWETNLGKYLLDVSKYVLTGVVITSLFKDVTDKTMVYVVSIAIVLLTLWTGLRLTNKKE